MTAEREHKKDAEQAAGEPTAPTPANQDAEAAETPAAAAGEPVAPTPETQTSEPQTSEPQTSEPTRTEARPAEPPAAAVAAAAPAPRPGVSAGGAFVLGLVAALLLIGVLAAVAIVTFPSWRPQLVAALVPPDDGRIDAVETRASRLSEQQGALAGRIDGLEKSMDGLRNELGQRPAATATPDGDLGQRLAAVESAPRVDPARLEQLSRDQEQLGRQLAQTQEAVSAVQKGAADAATVLRLTDRIEAAENAVRQAQSRALTAQSLLLAVGQLREAINRGDGFDAELRSVRAIAQNDPQIAAPLDVLAAAGGKPIATRAVLASDFDELSGRIVRAEIGPEEDGWWRQTVQRLASVITIRRTEGDVAGSSTAAVVARAQAALHKGNIAGAVQELSALQGRAAETAAPWLGQAQARLAAEKALSDLTAHAVAATQASNG